MNTMAQLSQPSALQAYANINTRRDAAIAAGRGAYSIGKKLNKFSRGKIGRGLLNVGAAALDPYSGGMASEALEMSGRGIYTGGGIYTGQGEYETNTLINNNNPDQIPQFSSANDETGAITISRKEYVADIYGPPSSTAFQIQSYAVNPGLEQSFPWLSQIAQNYDEYDMIQLIYT